MLSILNSKDIQPSDETSFQILERLLNEKKYTVSDTNYSYRQINSIPSTILGDKRENKRGWRKFSLKELIFLDVVKELRKYGILNKQLNSLADCFFLEDKKIKWHNLGYQDQIWGKNLHYISEEIIRLVLFSQKKIYLIMSNDGEAHFVDEEVLYLFINIKSFIFVNIGNLIWDVYQSKITSFATLGYVSPIADFIRGKRPQFLFPNERKIIDLIKDKTYGQINIKKQNKDFVIKADKVSLNSKRGLTDEEIISVVRKGGKYTSVNFEVRDGNVVHADKKDVFKT